jgi:hypothetical protein
MKAVASKAKKMGRAFVEHMPEVAGVVTRLTGDVLTTNVAGAIRRTLLSAGKIKRYKLDKTEFEALVVALQRTYDRMRSDAGTEEPVGVLACALRLMARMVDVARAEVVVDAVDDKFANRYALSHDIDARRQRLMEVAVLVDGTMAAVEWVLLLAGRAAGPAVITDECPSLSTVPSTQKAFTRVQKALHSTVATVLSLAPADVTPETAIEASDSGVALTEVYSDVVRRVMNQWVLVADTIALVEVMAEEFGVPAVAAAAAHARSALETMSLPDTHRNQILIRAYESEFTFNLSNIMLMLAIVVRTAALALIHR